MLFNLTAALAYAGVAADFAALRASGGCLDSNNQPAPCQPGIEKCRGGQDPKHIKATFHVHDQSCGLNDPNGPFYDPKHKMYHLFYQDHLHQETGEGVHGGRGPIYGHAVSADLVKWTHLPVAIWNDQVYDSVAIYTGSVTVVPANA